MYIRLTKPGIARAAHVHIEAIHGEVVSEVLTDMDDDAIRRQLAVWERCGFDPRRFLMWPHLGKDHAAADEHGILKVQPRVLELTIPGRKPQAIITNYDVMILSDRGQRIDRLFRYDMSQFEPLEGDIVPGAGVVQAGTGNEPLDPRHGGEGDDTGEVLPKAD